MSDAAGQPVKEKFVRVKCLSKQLSLTSNVFISSILLFNLQAGPPINMAPVLRAEVGCLVHFCLMCLSSSHWIIVVDRLQSSVIDANLFHLTHWPDLCLVDCPIVLTYRKFSDRVTPKNCNPQKWYQLLHVSVSRITSYLVYHVFSLCMTSLQSGKFIGKTVWLLTNFKKRFQILLN